LAKILPSTRLLPANPIRAVDLLASAGFSEIEVNYASFERSNVDYPSLPNWLRLVLLEALRLGVSVPVVHGPWEDYFLPYLGRGVEAAVSEALLLAEISHGYGVEILVLHPFSARRLGAGRATWINKRFFAILAERLEAEELGLRIAVENTSREPPWNNISETRGLVEAVASEKIGMCLDFGHAGINGYTPGAALKEAAGREICIHLHDNHGRADEHLPPGCGSLDWSSLAEAPKTRATYIVLESDCSGGTRNCLARLRSAAVSAKVLLEPVLP